MNNYEVSFDQVTKAIEAGKNVYLTIDGEYYDIKQETKTDFRPWENEAKKLCDAIRTMADKPENIDNFESYLSYHFKKWFDTWASTPAGIADEFDHFANMI